MLTKCLSLISFNFNFKVDFVMASHNGHDVSYRNFCMILQH